MIRGGPFCFSSFDLRASENEGRVAKLVAPSSKVEVRRSKGNEMTTSLRVAFQGESGAFSESAARRLLGEPLTTVPCPTFEEMFAAVTDGGADCCMAPIENSLAGSIHRNYDLLLGSDLRIAG